MAYKRGDRWVGFYRDAAGKQHTNGNFHRKRDADRWEQEQKAAIRNDTWVDPGRSRMTVGEWSETWLAGRVHLKPKTLSSYRSLLTTRVLPAWDQIALTRIRHSDVVAWVAAMRAELSASRTRQAYHLLFSMLADAVKDNRLTRNPALGVDLPRLPRGDRRYLTHQQLADLADGCGPHRLMVLVAGYTGLRWGELTGLRAPCAAAARAHRRRGGSRRGRRADGLRYAEDPSAPFRRGAPLPAGPACGTARRQGSDRPRVRLPGRHAAARAELPSGPVRPSSRCGRDVRSHPARAAAHRRIPGHRVRRVGEGRAVDARPRLRADDPGPLRPPVRGRTGRGRGPLGRRSC